MAAMAGVGGPARLERHRQPRHRREHVRPQEGAVPGDRRAPVVADDDAGLMPQHPHQIDHVADEMQDGVVLRPLRLVGAAIAAHVRRDRVVASVGQGRDLGAPADPKLRKAVNQQDQSCRPVARSGLQDLLDQAVGLDAARRERPGA
jgi:hypothetical protein